MESETLVKFMVESWYLAQGPRGKESQAVISPVGAILAWHVVTGPGVGVKGYFLVCSSWQ